MPTLFPSIPHSSLGVGSTPPADHRPLLSDPVPSRPHTTVTHRASRSSTRAACSTSTSSPPTSSSRQRVASSSAISVWRPSGRARALPRRCLAKARSAHRVSRGREISVISRRRCSKVGMDPRRISSGELVVRRLPQTRLFFVGLSPAACCGLRLAVWHYVGASVS